MTASEIFILLINSEKLSITVLLPPSYKSIDVDRLKRDISNFKARNKHLYEDILGECVLSYESKELEDKSTRLTVRINDSHPKATEWEGITLEQG